MMKSDSLHFEDSPDVTRGSFKIALIRKNYTLYGGAENYLNLVADRLLAQGHEVHIFSANHTDKSSFQTHRVKAVKKPSLLSNISFALNARALLKKHFFDCILSFERTLYQDFYRAGDGCHREWLNRRRIIEPFLKKISFNLNPHHLMLLYLEKQCFLGSKAIIANSTMVKKDIIKHYAVPAEKIHLIYNGVDLQRFRPIGKEQKNLIKNSLDIKNNKVVLFVGADFKRKGLFTLLKAFSLLDIKDLKLIVAGKPAETRHLSMAKKLGIDRNVIFMGAVKEIERLYSIADVFVLPTVYDPFSNATLEAMASGIPAITTSCNGASELIENGVQGFAINNPLDAHAFAEKISIALQQSEQMGKQARIRAEDYSIEKAVNEIIKVISNK
jgi:UDP-glucose:(heptosyl)LPS alpha-1,3-glucosyltransferase